VKDAIERGKDQGGYYTGYYKKGKVEQGIHVSAASQEEAVAKVKAQMPEGATYAGAHYVPSVEQQQATTAPLMAQFEPGAEGKPQAIMPGMEPSARQLAAARAGPLRAGVPQEEPGELFSAPHEAIPDMFLFNGQPQSFAEALREVDGLKIAADQIAACAAPEQLEAA
jgi:hypothetical protein